MLRFTIAFVVFAVSGPWVNAADDLTPVAIGYQTTIQSRFVGEARDILVYLPANYETRDEAYPVLVLLDGRGHFHHTTAAVEYLSRAHLMPEMIVVGIPNTHRTRDFTVNRGQWLERQEGGGADAFLDFLEKEVLVWVDGRFRTAPHRTLVGHSLGASLACYALVSRPDLFQTFVLHSPAISAEERLIEDGAVSMTARVKGGFAVMDDRPRRVYVTMSGFEAEAWIEDWRSMRRVFRTHAPDSLDFRQENLPDESHTTVPLSATPDALRWLFEGWDGVEAARSDDIAELEAHFAELSRRMGYVVEPPEDIINTMGYRLLQSGRVKEAIETFRRNVAIHPESANVHDSLGESLEASGDLEEAARCYAMAVERATRLDPQLRVIFERNLERVTQRLGEETAS